MGKGISMQVIKMYEEMINEKYMPLINLLREQSAASKPSVEVQVKKELGIYDLFTEKEMLEKRQKEIDKNLEEWCEYKEYGYTPVFMERSRYGGSPTRLDAAIDRRMVELHGDLSAVMAAMKNDIDNIRLLSAGDNVREVFGEITRSIEQQIDLIKSRPLPMSNVKLIENGRNSRRRTKIANA